MCFGSFKDVTNNLYLQIIYVPTRFGIKIRPTSLEELSNLYDGNSINKGYLSIYLSIYENHSISNVNFFE